MNRFQIFLALVGCMVGPQPSMAQYRMGDVPDAFFGAQRGHVVSRPHGGFRMHYGRGLTDQGASVISTGITTLGPLIPSIVQMFGAVPVNVNGAPASDSPALDTSGDSACEFAADRVLDDLALADKHQEKARILVGINDSLLAIGKKLNISDLKRIEIDGDIKTPDVVGGGVINFPEETLPTPGP